MSELIVVEVAAVRQEARMHRRCVAIQCDIFSEKHCSAHCLGVVALCV
jgi:hypothetical protein